MGSSTRGLANCASTANAPTLTLPAGLRPPADEVFPIASGDGINDVRRWLGVIEVDSDGNVNAAGGYDSRAVSLGAIPSTPSLARPRRADAPRRRARRFLRGLGGLRGLRGFGRFSDGVRLTRDGLPPS